ncbi:hypothetical protein GQR58_029766 [Nymphon striatum]|nr:hypothetical protein GQR58_029766 [Nymphon striatum]
MKFTASLLPITLLFFTFSTLAQSTISSSVISREMDPEKSILTNTETSENHKTLLAVLKAADLDDILSHDGPFTVFAPSDLAFEKLSKKTVAALLDPSNKKELQQSFTTVQGDELTGHHAGVDIILTDNLGNTAKITTADSNQAMVLFTRLIHVFRPVSYRVYLVRH